MSRWEGRGGVGITGNSTYNRLQLDQGDSCRIRIVRNAETNYFFFKFINQVLKKISILDAILKKIIIV